MQKSLNDPIKVLVVDDSAVVRGLISRMLEKDDELTVVDTVANGEIAIKRVRDEKVDIDVVILDIEMPVMDGLTALPEILKIDPEIKVIMASTLTLKNAEISLQALQAGASDYIGKPTTSRELTGGQSFEHELVDKVKNLGVVRKKSIGGAKAGVETKLKPVASSTFVLAKSPIVTPKPHILAVGSSTGGPQALFELFGGLQGAIEVPILVTQHMPATFTAILAQHINRSSGMPASEAENGEVLKRGHIYIAPGDYHMTIENGDNGDKIKLDKNPPVNFCRPAIDPMLESIVNIHGNKTLVVILTGMGYDGLNGSKLVNKIGGTVIGQDEESSVVWLTDDWCIEKRNEIARRFLKGDVISRRKSGISSDDFVQEVEIHRRDFAGKLAVNLEGLWENKQSWKDGPFRSYAFANTDRNRIDG